MTKDELRGLASRFDEDMRQGFHTLSREIGYRPTRFLALVAAVGGVEAARRLLRGPAVSDGFTTLAMHHRLAQSIEAWVLRPEYEPLFTEADRAAARRRLTLHEFDVDRYLGELAATDKSSPSTPGDGVNR